MRSCARSVHLGIFGSRPEIRQRPMRRYHPRDARAARFELLVPPPQVVAHVAAQLPAEPGARVRYRAHFDPCCFHVDVYDAPGAIHPAHSLLLLVWPDRGGGARLQPSRPPQRSLKLNLALALLGATPLALAKHPLWLLLMPVLVVALELSRETSPRRREVLEAEAFAALERVLAPLRRTGLPYREPAALPPGSGRQKTRA